MLIYVASPYSHEKNSVMHKRFMLVRKFVAERFEEEPDLFYFSPIVYWHETAWLHQLPTNADPFQSINNLMIDKAERLVVLALPEWRESLGIKAEMATAIELDKPISFIQFDRQTETFLNLA